ncbi:MAG: hypothetical protein ACKOXJ_05535 [Alphaproteobacteria bacterium]
MTNVQTPRVLVTTNPKKPILPRVLEVKPLNDPSRAKQITDPLCSSSRPKQILEFIPPANPLLENSIFEIFFPEIHFTKDLEKNDLPEKNKASSPDSPNLNNIFDNPCPLKICSALSCGLVCGATVAVAVPTAPIWAPPVAIGLGCVAGYNLAQKLTQQNERPATKL